MKKILDAVSIVLTHQDEMFIIQRQNHLPAFPGYWAFPGGKIEPYDREPKNLNSVFSSIESHVAISALRELKEELDFDFENNPGAISSVKQIGVALSPAFNPVRFSTHFLLINLHFKPAFKLDTSEIFQAFWSKSSDLLKRYHAGDLLVVPPVLSIIETFQTDLLNCASRLDQEAKIPFVESLYRLRQYMPLSNTLPPAERTNCFVIDDKIVVDPSPKSDEEYRELIYLLKNHPLKILFLSHHHPDHYERSNQLARELGLDVWISSDSYLRIEKKNPGYFSNIKIHHPKEGEVIGTWLNKKILVIEVPGHDEGQLALMSESKEWFFAGDLFQGMGSVVVGGEEGNMKKYMQTLQKVIDINPQNIYPSHGIGLGGINILKKNLEHRKMREEQILVLLKKGLNEDEILSTLYSDVPVNLHIYARENIKKHAEKLKEEGRI